MFRHFIILLIRLEEIPYFKNASRVKQILSDMEQGKEPTATSARELVNIYNREITKKKVVLDMFFKEQGGNFGYFIDKGKNERLKCKYDALKNVSLFGKKNAIMTE